ncbi:hypothetical protein AV274_3211 [Blastocystis sp. ATCC 50177/Nand II]|uniref:Nucleolar protein 16 n=1 Tax=Blastocystis sp. subtype 1 (strain ATCC 50177 / NandII) TaxID=478820 RepID=A0A196SDJ8_BLAHN|nr:hypothetical protein AV274_6258 [Blastocystis sp. ATCC 50177/Nand II]OAO15083.1 hypothetical protein AV274_3211 [Blastocystis sp. ATCC 50177/Nand II]
MPYARRRLKKKGPRVSLKQNNLLKYRRGTHANGKLSKVWDNNKTILQNYERMGIIADTNHPEQTHKTDDPLIQFVPQEQVKNERILISCHDQTICRKLITKYGDDYEAMFRDIKLNPQQLTARQLEKQCEKYKKYLEMYDEKVPTKETKTEELKTEASEEKTNEEEDASLLD